MEIKEMIEVMEHFEKGGTVEFSWKDETEWYLTNKPSWDWFTFEYRIYKPKIKIEKWLIQEPESGVYCVVELSDIDKYIRDYNAIKIKLLESYEVGKD